MEEQETTKATVTMPISEYDELLKFKKAFEESQPVMLDHSYNCKKEYYWLTPWDVTFALKGKISELESDLRRYRERESEEKRERERLKLKQILESTVRDLEQSKYKRKPWWSLYLLNKQ